jgi:hypothetical protein
MIAKEERVGPIVVTNETDVAVSHISEPTKSISAIRITSSM